MIERATQPVNATNAPTSQTSREPTSMRTPTTSQTPSSQSVAIAGQPQEFGKYPPWSEARSPTVRSATSGAAQRCTRATPREDASTATFQATAEEEPGPIGPPDHSEPVRNPYPSRY